MPMTASRKEVEHRASTELPISTLEPFHPFLFSHSEVVRMEKRFFAAHSGRCYQRKTDRLVSRCFLNSRSKAVLSTLKSSLHQNLLNRRIISIFCLRSWLWHCLQWDTCLTAALIAVVLDETSAVWWRALRTINIDISSCNHVTFLLENWKPFLLLLYYKAGAYIF